jgi:hypothetical protein
MTTDEAYKTILKDAVQIANKDHRIPRYLSGDTFALPEKTDQLTLWLSPLVEYAIEDTRFESRPKDQVIDELHTVVADAIRQAITENPQAFVELIVDEAREGRGLLFQEE